MILSLVTLLTLLLIPEMYLYILVDFSIDAIFYEKGQLVFFSIFIAFADCCSFYRLGPSAPELALMFAEDTAYLTGKIIFTPSCL